jgi:hypothetical protein
LGGIRPPDYHTEAQNPKKHRKDKEAHDSQENQEHQQVSRVFFVREERKRVPPRPIGQPTPSGAVGRATIAQPAIPVTPVEHSFRFRHVVVVTGPSDDRPRSRVGESTAG